MAAPGRKVPKRGAGRGAVGRAPRRKTAKAGDVLARQPARRAAPHAERRDDEPHLRAADPAPGRPRAVGAAPAAPGDGRGRAVRRLSACSALVASSTGAGAAGRAARSHGLACSVRGGARWPLVGDGRRSGCWSAGSGPGPPAVELVRLAQRARRHVRRGRRRAVVRPRGHRHAAAHVVVAARSGATVGRGVWCETYWLPEADLVELGDGATVNQGSVVQTHLFHDRMLSTDTVRLRRGATLGPNSVILPAATHRAARYGRPGVAGDEGGVGARQDALDRQPDRSVERPRTTPRSDSR